VSWNEDGFKTLIKDILVNLTLMGKLCCSEEDGGLDLSKFLIVIVLAFAIMAVCMPPPQRAVFAVYRCR
ncbi:Transmembrane protein, partial [Parasponia andersonii]